MYVCICVCVKECNLNNHYSIGLIHNNSNHNNIVFFHNIPYIVTCMHVALCLCLYVSCSLIGWLAVVMWCEWEWGDVYVTNHSASRCHTHVFLVWSKRCASHCCSNNWKRSWLRYRGLPRLYKHTHRDIELVTIYQLLLKCAYFKSLSSSSKSSRYSEPHRQARRPLMTMI